MPSPEDYLALIQQDGEASLRLSAMNAVDKQPDSEAALRKLAQDYRLPLEAVRLERPQVERRSRLDAIDYGKLAREMPATAEMFRDPNVAGVIHDDVDNLGALEKTLQTGKNLGKAAASGYFGFGEGAAGMMQAGADALAGVTGPIADFFGTPDVLGRPLARDMAALRQNQTAWREYLMPKGGGNIESGVYSGVQSLTQNLLTLPLAIAANNPALALNTMAGLTGGQSYGKARDKGLDPGQAALFGAADAAVEYGTEMIPVGRLFGDLNAGAPFFKTLANQLATEIPGEQVATAFQDLNEWAVLNPDKTFGDYLAARPDAAIQTLVATAVGTGGTVSVLKGAEALATRGIDQAEQNGGYFNQLRSAASASKTLNRAPDLVEKLVNDALGDDAHNVYIDAKAFMQSGVADQVQALLPEVAEQLPQAIASGGEIRIPVGDVVTKLGNTEFFQPLADHMRLADQELSAFDARQLRDNIPAAIRDAAEAAFTRAQTEQALAAGADQVKSRVLEQLAATGRFQGNANENYATLVGQYYATQAQRFGMSPETMFERYPVNVDSVIGGGRLLNQASVQTLDDVRKQWDEAGITHGLSENSDVITLSKIVVPDEMQNQGKGTAAIQQLVDYADKAGKHIVLSPAADFGGNKKRLVGFYKRFGFIENKGKNKAYSVSEAMYRPAKDKILYQSASNQGPFGPILTDYARNASAAIAKLTELQTGEAIGALHHPDIGDIDLVWGDAGTGASDGYGLAKLVKFHPEVVGNLQEIISGMQVVSRSDNRINLESADHKAGVRLTWDNQAKHWLMTAFEKRKKGAAGTRTDTTDATGKDDTASLTSASDAIVDQTLNKFYQDARGAYSPDTNTIALLEKADLSTFLHESGHMFLELHMNMMTNLLTEDELVGTTEAQKQLIADTNTLLHWFGLQNVQEWFNLDFEQKRAYHEQFAEAFEKYLFEGKAPSTALERVFASFRQWMKKVYEHIKSRFSDVQLDDDVRGVFDRMLATDAEIKHANKVRSLMPLFAAPQQAGMDEQAYRDYLAANKEAVTEAMEVLALKGVKDMQWLHNAKNRTLKRLQKQHTEIRREVRAAIRDEVMSEPVYRAWTFLTGKIKPQDAIEQQKPAKSDPNRVEPDKDNLFVAIAKLGGLQYEQIAAEWNYDEPGRVPTPIFGKPIARKNGGQTLEEMAEKLLDLGYLRADNAGRYDLREFEELFAQQLRGEDRYSNQFNPYTFGQDEPLPGEQVINPAALHYGRLDYFALSAWDGLPAEAPQLLKERGMTAKDGLHPQIVADLFPEFDSADALLQALVAAEPPADVIERLTDARMIAENAELSDDEAINRAADAAVFNEARVNFLAREYNALNKATGNERLLAAAAKQLAEQTVDRLQIKNLSPIVYVRAEVRAAKAAQAAHKAGDTEQAATEKRNQLFNAAATKAAYQAQDDVQKWLDYFKAFYKDSKTIQPEDLKAIRSLLNHYDFKFVSNAKLADTMKIRAWVDELLSRGEPVPYLSEAILSGPELAAYVRSIEARNADGELIYPDPVDQVRMLADAIDRSQRKPYKEAAIEELRGLYDTLQAMEQSARQFNKLLTSEKAARVTEVIDELAASITEHGGDGGKNVGTRHDVPGRIGQSINGFFAAHLKIPVLAKIMDGGQDNGPMWHYVVRTFNKQSDWQTSEKARAAEAIDKILWPLLKQRKFGLKFSGEMIPELGFSMTWEERFAVVLNMGNEGNWSRLEMGGIPGRAERLTPRQLMTIAGTLTRDELQAVQQVWSFIDGYKPQLQAQMQRLGQMEPNWVTPRPLTVTSADGHAVELKGGYYPIVYDRMANDIADMFKNAETLDELLKAANHRATTQRGFLKERVSNVQGRPLQLNLQGLIGGVNDVIHSLAWQEWIIDMNKLFKPNSAATKAIREYYGPETTKELNQWFKDIVIGQRKLDDGIGGVVAFFRHNSSAAAMMFNVGVAALQPTGLINSGVMVGWKWIGQGIAHVLNTGPIKALDMAREKSTFLANRSINRARDLYEMKTDLSGTSHYQRFIGHVSFALIVQAQLIADLPTWYGAYFKALAADPNNEVLAIALADQAVKDTQGGGEVGDLSRVERASEVAKLFTSFYMFQNVQLNMLYAQYKTNANKPAWQQQTARTAVNMLLIGLVQVQLGWMLKEALQPDGGGDDESIMGKALKEELAYLFGLFVLAREVGQVINSGVENYRGPPAFRSIIDSGKLGIDILNQDFDNSFRKDLINVLGEMTGAVPSAQLNKSITGLQALADDKTDNPAAAVFGYRK